MGTFATYTSLDLLIPGVKITNTAASLAAKCIVWAENQVKSKLSRRYDISGSPFLTSTSVPPQITSITEMIASGHLFKQLSRGAPESIDRGNEIIKDGMDQLISLATGESHLLDTSGSFVGERTDSVREYVIHSASGYHTTFDEDDPINWKIDPDKIDDIESGRS